MTIEIRKPELQALILQRMKESGFHDIEDVLMQALQTSVPPRQSPVTKKRTGADLIAAMQASPYREIEIEPERFRLPVRHVTY
jgi:hypothetical protein